MEISILYFIGFMVYLFTVCMNYSDKAKAAFWYYPLGMVLSLVSNYIWMYLAKNSENPNQVYVRGLVWDSMIIFCYSILPFFFFSVKFGIYQSIGVGLVLIGLGLIKFA
jgi:multidrug transporter EmrE-like cation transporter